MNIYLTWCYCLMMVHDVNMIRNMYEMHDYMVINYVLLVCIVVVIGG